MTEISYFWDNPGTGDSPGGGYGHDELIDVFAMLWGSTANLGVVEAWLNELEVTDGGVDTATVLTGAALVDGFFYESDANVDVDVNAFRSGTCHIVVEADWAAQTVRLAAVAALTQTDGVLYDIPLEEVSVDAVGNITLDTDEREFCSFPTVLLPDSISDSKFDTDAVTTDKLVDRSGHRIIAAGKLEPDGTNPADWHYYSASYTHYDSWLLGPGAVEAVWFTIRMPEDMVGTDVDLYVWNAATLMGAAGDVRWEYNGQHAAASAALAGVNGALDVTVTGRDGSDWYRDKIADLVLSAGELVHMQISRNGAHGNDTYTEDVYLLAIELAYSADS